jgi:hypothetical protein
MRSVAIIVGGLLLLGVFVIVGRWLGGPTAESTSLAARVFLPVWLVLALINMWIGVSRAGYTVSEELPIFAAIFGLPGLAAAFIWWRFS